MARNDVELTFVGNTTSDITLNQYNGRDVANFNLAATPQKWNNETKSFEDAGTPLYLRGSVWGAEARNLHATWVAMGRKSLPLIVKGNLQGNEYEKDGQKRYSLQLSATTVGLALTFFAVSRLSDSNAGSSAPSNGGNSAAQGNDPWSDDSSAGSDEPPF